MILDHAIATSFVVTLVPSIRIVVLVGIRFAAMLRERGAYCCRRASAALPNDIAAQWDWPVLMQPVIIPWLLVHAEGLLFVLQDVAFLTRSAAMMLVAIPDVEKLNPEMEIALLCLNGDEDACSTYDIGIDISLDCWTIFFCWVLKGDLGNSLVEWASRLDVRRHENRQVIGVATAGQHCRNHEGVGTWHVT
jgi:hypothetical protein